MKNFVFATATYSVTYKTDLTNANPEGNFTIMSIQSSVLDANGVRQERNGISDALTATTQLFFKQLAKYTINDFIAAAGAIAGAKLYRQDNDGQTPLAG